MTASALPSLDLALRGGACAGLGLIAALVLRDFGRLGVARLAALFALGSAAFAVKSAPGFAAAFPIGGLALTVLATGNPVVFWVFARKLFDDGFRPGRRHAALWSAILALQLVNQLGLIRHTGLQPYVWAVLVFQAPAFALLAAGQTVAGWREDLVDRRRTLRVFVVAAGALYTLLSIGPDFQGAGPPSEDMSLFSAAALLAIVLAIAGQMLAVSPRSAVSMALAARDRPAAATPGLTAADRRVLARLETLMTVERAYRQDGLTVAALAARLGLPEYRLRRLINQGLGHRNFSSFVNGYRIGDAKAALVDPGEVETPILTIALDSGFASLGPFNRAFKAETGLTPSDYRALHAMADPATSPISTRRSSKSA
jgi:AraC-like DNA-binding protein